MKKITILIMACFCFACEAKTEKETPENNPPEPEVVKPEKVEKPVEKPKMEDPAALAAKDKQEAEATINDGNADAEAEKLLKEIEADLE